MRSATAIESEYLLQVSYFTTLSDSLASGPCPPRLLHSLQRLTSPRYWATQSSSRSLREFRELLADHEYLAKDTRQPLRQHHKLQIAAMILTAPDDAKG